MSDPRDDFLSLLAIHGDAQCQLHYPLQICRANLRVSRLLDIGKAIDDLILAIGLTIGLVKLGVILVEAVYDRLECVTCIVFGKTGLWRPNH